MRDPAWWQLPALLLLSVAYEALFLHHGLNRIDEGWMLHAATQLHEGGILYRDVFFGYPPGQLLPAWLGVAIDPPGVVGGRIVNAAFATAMVAALYALGRCIMPSSFALLGAGMLAVAAPRSHLWHYLFGYRFLVISALALLAYRKRLESDDPRWMLAAGMLVGLAAVFRLETAMASGFAIVLGILASGGTLREIVRDGIGLGVGTLAVLVPVAAWLALDVDLEIVWSEIFVRAVLGSGQQDLPMPPLAWPDAWTRGAFGAAFTALQFRLYPALFVAYAVWLTVLWLRHPQGGERFPHTFLLVVVAWGGIYLTRAFGRADAAHMDMVLPGPCILLAHALSLSVLRSREKLREWTPVACATAFAVWVLLVAPDRALSRAWRGDSPFASLDGAVYARPPEWTETLDRTVELIRERTGPDDAILDLSTSPILYVLAERRAAGHHDVLMPGTFLDEDEELEAIERLAADPPALIVWPRNAFDGLESRSVPALAPHLAEWVRERYALDPESPGYYLLLRPLAATPRP